MELLTPVPSGCLFTANSCPVPGSALQTPLPSTQPHSTPVDTRGDTLGFAGLQHRPCVQILLCLAFHRLVVAFPSDLLKLLLCPTCFPHHEGASLNVGTSPLLQLPARGADPFPFPLSFFLSFVLPSCMGIFHHFRCLRSSTRVQCILCENSSICRCILFFLINLINLFIWLC